MNCERCKGACCEAFSLPVSDLSGVPNDDALTWVLLHGDTGSASPERPDHWDGYVEFECSCKALDQFGSCSIYQDRPQVCRDFERGGVDCLEMVKRRRTPAEYQIIRDGDDPLTIHGEDELAETTASKGFRPGWPS